MNMWLFKANDGKYLHSYGVRKRFDEDGVPHSVMCDVIWVESQKFALRFYERNEASLVGMETKVPGRVITLLAGGTNKRLDAIEKKTQQTQIELDAALQVHTSLLGSVVSDKGWSIPKNGKIEDPGY